MPPKPLPHPRPIAPPPARPPQPPPKPSQPLSPAHRAILLRHRLSQPTVNALVALPPASPPDEILAAACHATELTSFPLRPAERALFSHMNGFALWPLAVSHPTQTWEKAFLIVQATASGEEWAYAPRIATPARDVLLSERRRIVTTVVRALRCAAEIMSLKSDAVGFRRTLELARCVAAGAWEGPGGRELLQVGGVGVKKMEALAKAGISTVKKLAGMEFYHIERILKRNPPFGQELVMKLEGFPMTGMRARVERWATPEDEAVARKIEGFPCPEVTGARRLALVRVQVWVANKTAPCWRDKSPWVCVAAERGMRPAGHHVGAARRGPQSSTMSTNPDGAGELLFDWRCSTKTMLGEGRTTLFMAALVPGEAFFLWMSCEEIVGTLIETVVKAPVE